MFLKAGLVSLALLVASRLLGLLRESAQAAAFGASGLADAVVLMLTLPDMLAGVLASGSLAYVLLPHWANRSPAHIAVSQRVIARRLLALGLVALTALVLGQDVVSHSLAAGMPPDLEAAAAQGVVWAALAVPAALMAALWSTRLQHDQDFVGLYGANLIVNTILIGALLAVAFLNGGRSSIAWLGIALLAAAGARLAWLALRLSGWQAGRAPAPTAGDGDARATAAPGSGNARGSHTDRSAALPSAPLWAWAALAAGVPLAIPFAARSIASQDGEGALATFNYAWKLVELPLLLAIQLIATLAFPAIARALAPSGDGAGPAAAGSEPRSTLLPVRSAFALAWTLGCAAAAGLLWGAPALTSLLFGWGRMDPTALQRVAQWGAAGAWSLLPQAVIAVTLTVLAARARLRAAAVIYLIALAAFLLCGLGGVHDGQVLMWLLDGLFLLIAIALVGVAGRELASCIPWSAATAALLALLAAELVRTGLVVHFSEWNMPLQLVLSGFVAIFVIAATALASADLRCALRR